VATRSCPIGADGIVQKRPRTVVTPIRRHPSIRRALPITAGRHTGGHQVAMPRPGPGTMRCHSDNGASTAGPRSITLALLTRVSRRPSSETVCSTARTSATSSSRPTKVLSEAGKLLVLGTTTLGTSGAHLVPPVSDL
jgi:hypothetical protein